MATYSEEENTLAYFYFSSVFLFHKSTVHYLLSSFTYKTNDLYGVFWENTPHLFLVLKILFSFLSSPLSPLFIPPIPLSPTVFFLTSSGNEMDTMLSINLINGRKKGKWEEKKMKRNELKERKQRSSIIKK